MKAAIPVTPATIEQIEVELRDGQAHEKIAQAHKLSLEVVARIAEAARFKPRL